MDRDCLDVFDLPGMAQSNFRLWDSKSMGTRVVLEKGVSMQFPNCRLNVGFARIGEEIVIITTGGPGDFRDGFNIYLGPGVNGGFVKNWRIVEFAKSLGVDPMELRDALMAQNPFF